MASVTIRGATLDYGETGSGAPVVLVHGSACDRRTWDGRREALADRYRVIDYSRRYHWPNEPIPAGADYSMAEQVDDLVALVRQLDAAPAHLVGHSYGAFLCLVAALREPSLVRSLVLAEPPVVTLFVSKRPKPAELLKLWLTRPRTAAAIVKFGVKGMAPAARAFREGDVERGIRAFGEAIFGRGGLERLSESQKIQARDNASTVVADLRGSGLLPLNAKALRGLDVPVLLITGARSIALFQRLADGLEALLPRTQRVTLPGASHVVHEDNPSAFDEAVLRFLGEHPGSPGDAS